jgi:hypothetical protein
MTCSTVSTLLAAKNQKATGLPVERHGRTGAARTAEAGSARGAATGTLATTRRAGHATGAAVATAVATPVAAPGARLAGLPAGRGPPIAVRRVDGGYPPIVHIERVLHNLSHDNVWREDAHANEPGNR